MKIYQLPILILFATITQAIHAETSSPVLSNTQFQQCLDNLQKSAPLSQLPPTSFNK